jgi:hypothetical protein
MVYTQRLRVPGGWIYETTCYGADDEITNSSTVFVPAPEVVGYPI